MFPKPRLLNLARSSRSWLALTIAFGFFSGLLTIGQARTVSLIISRVFLDGANLPAVRSLLGWTLLFFLLRTGMAWGSSISGKTIAVKVKTRVRKMLLDHLETLGPAFLQQERSGEISRTLVDGVEALDAYYSEYLPQLVLTALVPLSILIFVFPMDLLSGIILLVTAPLIPFFMLLIGNTAREITDRQYGILSRLSAQFLDSLQGLTTLKLFNQAKARTEVIADSSDRYRRTTMQVLRITFLSALALELLATLSTAVVAVQIGLRLLYFRISFEQAFFLLIIAPEFYLPLRQLGLRFHAGMEGQSAAERIFTILDTQPLRDPEARVESPASWSFPLQELALDQVSFTYPGESGAVLRGISLSLQAGEHVALVGESGAGKSTLASLILGFFPPGAGAVRVNGQPLGSLRLESWRESIAWVPQQPALFEETIAANIRLARPEASHQAVVRAARAAHLAGFIESLPRGYQTRIGEGGARLSGGQAQRLALARAFLKDAPLLILDEPTSQLDPGTETRLAAATRKLMEGRTVLTIAHRLNTICRADRILVLQEGRVIEEGSHQELMAAGKTYPALVRAYTGGQPPGELNSRRGEMSGLRLPSGEDAPQALQPPDQLFRKSEGESVWLRLLQFLKPHWQPILLSVLLGFLTIGASVGLMGTSAWLISAAALHPSIADLQIAIVGVRFFGVLRGVARYLERLSSHEVTFRVLGSLRAWFYRSLAPLAPARLQHFRAGDLLSRILSDIKTLENFYIRSTAPPLVAGLLGTAVGVFLSGYHPPAGWLLGAFYLLHGLMLPLMVQRLARGPGRRLVQVRSRLHEGLVQFVQGLPDLQVFGRAAAFRDQLQRTSERCSRAQLDLARISGLSEAAGVLIPNLAMWLVLISAVPAVRAGELPGVMLAVLALMTLSAFEAVQPLPRTVETLSSSLKAGERLFELVSADPAVRDPAVPAPLPESIRLTAEKVSFTYPGAERPALQQISFQIQEGELMAVVGPSGAGKSTLLNLLLRFWGDFQGELTLGVDRVPLQSLSQKDVRRRFSVVSQTGYLFHDTLRANIALGKPDAADDEIASAAEVAGIDRWIRSLPQGYQTPVGERGQLLSAGERQRIAIARAVLKDAPFFLLDEPTANLDPLTERSLLETLLRILEQKTGLLITHRLVGLSRADRIIVLSAGEVVERGTEAELLSSGSLYRQLWLQQNAILRYS